MNVSEIIALCAGGLMTIVTGVLLFIFKGYIADLKKYRAEREVKEKAKDDLILGLARVTLLETYQRCEQKGYYSLEDRDVYGKLFDAYVTSGGDGIIDTLAPKIRALPTRPDQGDDAA